MSGHDPDGGPSERPVVPRHTTCLVLTFGYERDGSDVAVRLVGAARVRGIAPGIATDPPDRDQSGAWVELRDVDARLVWYRHLHDPIPTTQEVFSDEGDGPTVARKPSAPTSGEFDVTVPDLDGAASIQLFATLPPPLLPRRKRGAPEEIHAQMVQRLDVDEVRHSADDQRG